MKQALWLFDCLIARFDGDLDPEARRLVVQRALACSLPLRTRDAGVCVVSSLGGSQTVCVGTASPDVLSLRGVGEGRRIRRLGFLAMAC
jgi:hypothetical protein